MKSKILVYILSFIMVITMIPGISFANEPNDTFATIDSAKWGGAVGCVSLEVIHSTEELPSSVARIDDNRSIYRIYQEINSDKELKIYTDAETIYLPADCDNFFKGYDGTSLAFDGILNTTKVTSMEGMFGVCSKIETLDISNFDTMQVTNMAAMFDGCSSLRFIYTSDRFNTQNVVKSDNMFKDCLKLEGGNSTFWDENKTDKSYARIDTPSKPGYFSKKDADALYWSVNQTTDGEMLKLSPVYSEETPHRCESIINPSVGWTVDSFVPWNRYGYLDTIKKVQIKSDAASPEHKIKPTKVYSWFTGMKALENIEGFENLDVSDVTEFIWVFSNCKALKDLDLRPLNFDSTKQIKMSGAFSGCSNLQRILVNDTLRVNESTSFSVFTNCINLVGKEGAVYFTNEIQDGKYAKVGGNGLFEDDADNCTVVFYDGNTKIGETLKVSKGDVVEPPDYNPGKYIVDKWTPELPAQVTTNFIARPTLKPMGDCSVNYHDAYQYVPGKSKVEWDDADFDKELQYGPDDKNFDGWYMILKDKYTSDDFEYKITRRTTFGEMIEKLREYYPEGYNETYVNLYSSWVEKDNINNTAKFKYLYEDELTYTGSEIEPTVRIQSGNGVLKEGRDYVMSSYDHNTDVGTGHIEIEGIGKYTGWMILRFEITPADMSDVTVAKIPDQAYKNGAPVTPTPSLSYKGKKIDNNLFDIAYEKNELPGQATAIITPKAGSHNYIGEKKVTFKIKDPVVKKVSKFGATVSKTNQITLNWTKSGTVTGFKIYKAGTKTLVKDVIGSTKKSFTIKGASGKVYKYEIAQYFTIDKTSFKKTYESARSSVAVAVTTPSKVTLSTLTSKSKTITAKWKKLTCTKYEAWIATNKSFTKGLKKVAVKSTAISTTVKSLKKGTTYYVKVRAVTTAKSGSKTITKSGTWSNVKSIKCK